MRRRRRMPLVLASAALAVGSIAAGCGGDDGGPDGGGSDLTGTIKIDGSSTVAPFAEAAAEQFQAENPGVRVTVGTSGTGGGFDKFCRGEADISDASREIEQDEIDSCRSGGVEFEELTVANDALSIVINPENDWATCLTIDQLNTIWKPASDVGNWRQVDPSFPDESLELFGPGTDSGTFDYFTEAVNGREGASRADYNNVGEDDNQTVTGVGGNKGGTGYLGFSFVQENEGTIVAAEIDGGSGCVAPSAETVQSGEYAPLGRPLFMYPSAGAIGRPEVKAFLDFVVEQNEAITGQALLIGLSDEQKQEARERLGALAGG